MKNRPDTAFLGENIGLPNTGIYFIKKDSPPL